MSCSFNWELGDDVASSPNSYKSLKKLAMETPTHAELFIVDTSQSHEDRAIAISHAEILNSILETAINSKFVELSKDDEGKILEIAVY